MCMYIQVCAMHVMKCVDIFVMLLIEICQWKAQAEHVTKTPDSVFIDDY